MSDDSYIEPEIPVSFEVAMEMFAESGERPWTASYALEQAAEAMHRMERIKSDQISEQMGPLDFSDVDPKWLDFTDLDVDWE